MVYATLKYAKQVEYEKKKYINVKSLISIARRGLGMTDEENRLVSFSHLCTRLPTITSPTTLPLVSSHVQEPHSDCGTCSKLCM